MLISCIILYGKTNKIDSLLNIFNKTKSDSIQINLCNTIGDLYEPTNPDSAISYYKKGLSLAKKINDKHSESIFLRYIGIIYYRQGNFNKAIDSFDKSCNIINKLLIEAKSVNNIDNIWDRKRDISICLNDIGNVHRDQGNYDKALGSFINALKISEELLNIAKQTNNNDKIKDQKKSMSKCFISIGTIHYFQNNYNKAIEYYLKSLNTFEELIASENKNGNLTNIRKFKQGLSACYNNIAMVNSDKANKNKSDQLLRNNLFNASIDYYKKSLAITQELGDKPGMSKCYNNFGATYKELKKYDMALDFYNKSLIIKKELGDKNGIATVWGNIADLHINIADNTTISTAEKNNHYHQAIIYGLKAYNLAKNINSKYLTYQEAVQLQKAYIALAMTKAALEFTEISSLYKDSLINEEQTKSLTEMETKYEAEKKQLEIENQILQLSKKDAEIKQQQAIGSRQKVIIGFVVSCLFFVIFILLILYRMFSQKKKTNKIITIKNNNLEKANEEIRTQRDEIESQKNLVVKQKNELAIVYEEQTDSIIYAQRIQQAVLPMNDYLNQFLKEYLILNKPKNIVSGDFFWITKVNKWTLFCVADCTGHGVPGAFMSMLGIALLNEIVRQEKITKASHVLDQLRKRVIESLKQRGVKGEQQDGMDIAFCALNTETLEMQFAGANNPCYIIANMQPVIAMAQPEAISTAQSDCFVPRNDDCQLTEPVIELSDSEQFDKLTISPVELIEIKGDKQPIGIHPNMQPFTNQIYQLQKGDTIYLMSDGYEDQFGGPYRKKFLAKNLKQLLTANSQLPMANQKHTLETTITDWIGVNEQIDDITIVGIKI